MRELWNRFWFREASPLGLIAVRTLLCLNALWIVLSRPNLPELVEWPSAFWRQVDPKLLTRFLILDFAGGFERVLYLVLWASLITSLLGVLPRLSCLLAALLLYHFAPFEDIFASSGGPFFRGLTVPVSGLFVLSFSRLPRWRAAPWPEFRWPLKTIQLLFSFTYLFAGLMKLRGPAGFGWFTARNFEGLTVAMVFPNLRPEWAHWFIGNEVLLWAGVAGALLLDFGPFLAVFSNRAARWIIPLVIIIHLVTIPVMTVVFLNIPLLLMFINWDWIDHKLRRGRTS